MSSYAARNDVGRMTINILPDDVLIEKDCRNEIFGSPLDLDGNRCEHVNFFVILELHQRRKIDFTYTLATRI